MVHTFRLAGGVTGSVASVLTAAIQTTLAVHPPQDDPARAFWAAAAAILGVIAILGILTFAVADWARERKRDALDRKRDKRERRRDKTLQDLLTKMAAMTQSAALAEPSASTVPAHGVEPSPPPKPTATTLWQAAVDLAAEIRALVQSVPDGLTLDEEHGRLFELFLTTYWERLRVIKDRLETVISPKWSVLSSTHWMANSKQNLRNIADNLEQEALKVDKDIPL